MKHWSNYWASTNTLNSFAESDTSKGYSGSIKEYWFEVFSALKPHSKVVDLGCGNGALACLAAEFSNKHGLDLEIHGVDAANINPVKSVKAEPETLKLLETIHFHPNTPIENLSFDENSIDLFMSQFGFEYSDMNLALQQCHKALNATGSIAIMAHHPDSFITKDTESGIEVLTSVLHISPLFIQIDLLLDIAAQVKASGQYNTWSQNPYNHSISSTIKWVLDQLKAQFGSDNYEVWLQDIFNRVVPIMKNVGHAEPQELRKHLAHQYKILDEHRVRLEEQLKAGLTLEKMESLTKQVKKIDRTLLSQPFAVDNESFAWGISIK